MSFLQCFTQKTAFWLVTGNQEFYRLLKRLWAWSLFVFPSLDLSIRTDRKIPKISPGAYFWRGLYSEGNLRFKIDWASLIVGRKFTIFAFFYLCIWGKFPSTSPPGAYIWRGDLTEGFLRYEFGGLIFGGARSPSNFMGSCNLVPRAFPLKNGPSHFLREKPWGRVWGSWRGLYMEGLFSEFCGRLFI